MKSTFNIFNIFNIFKRGALLTSFTMAALLVSAAPAAHAQAEPLTGDLGAGVYSTQGIIRSKGSQNSVLPYAFADYGRFFARVDTFGVKTVPMGYGYLELVGRVSQEGWKANTAALAGLTNRNTPIPLGIGTFQRTPYGAFIFNAFFDAGKSRGALVEATYAAEFKLGAVTFYPQVGLEHRSAKFTNYLYGVTAVESLASGYAAYNAGASTIPVLGLAADVPLNASWVVNMQLRQKWLDSALTNSPLVSRKGQSSGFIALSYRFK